MFDNKNRNNTENTEDSGNPWNQENTDNIENIANQADPKTVTRLQAFLVWICMGIADLVPWVSWWTIALLGWIYEKLIGSISSIKNALSVVFTQWVGLRTMQIVWKQINGVFLVLVFWWVLISALLGSRLLESLLEQHPIAIALFFSWLILASSFLVYFQYGIDKDTTLSQQTKLLLLLVWGAFGVAISIGNLWTLPANTIGFLIAGILWSIAMILPWISWSYILLLAGIYKPVIGTISWVSSAISAWDWSGLAWLLPDLGLFAVWIGIWLLTISNVLKRLLKNRHNQTLLFLIWCMIGALPAIVPERNDIVLWWSQSLRSFIAWVVLISGLLYPTLHATRKKWKKTVETVEKEPVETGSIEKRSIEKESNETGSIEKESIE